MKIVFATSFLFLTACATITRGPNEQIRVDSNPPGAAASIECDGAVRATGTTPAVLVIPRRAYNCIAQASANGRTKTVGLNRGVGGPFWANFSTFGMLPVYAFTSRSDSAAETGAVLSLSGGLGFLIDWMTGAMFDRDVHQVSFDLEH